MSNDHEAILKELEHPDPLQSVFAALWLWRQAFEDLLAYRLHVDAGVRQGIRNAQSR